MPGFSNLIHQGLRHAQQFMRQRCPYTRPEKVDTKEEKKEEKVETKTEETKVQIKPVVKEEIKPEIKVEIKEVPKVEVVPVAV